MQRQEFGIVFKMHHRLFFTGVAFEFDIANAGHVGEAIAQTPPARFACIGMIGTGGGEGECVCGHSRQRGVLSNRIIGCD